MSRDLSAKGFALWRSAMRWQRSVDAALRRLGLTHTRYLVLNATAQLQHETNDAVSQREIAARSELDESTVSGIARRLTGDGLLDRGPHGTDARLWRVIVTSEGNRVLRRARTAVEDASTAFFRKGSSQ
jgi:DNA-binding MarR family transcriptional regulator